MLIYDGALRGTHINELMTDVGLMSMSPIDPVSGAKGSGKPRVEKEVFIEEVDVNGGTLPRVKVYAYGGAAGVMGRSVDGTQFVELLELIQVRRQKNTDGTWRFYGEYKLPARLGGGTILLRHNATVEDRKRKFNRCENLRLFPNGSEQYKELYGRRSDAESSNRNLEDSLWLNRAHCLGR